jgi:transcriptional regulator with XRE-family HTH domain
MDDTHLGAQLADARKARGLTQDALARLVGIDRNTINRVERGRSRPSVATLAAWAGVLGVSLDALVAHGVAR